MARHVADGQQAAKAHASVRSCLSLITNLQEALGTAGEGDRRVRAAQGEAVD
jgi:hypothetical protein